MVSGAWLPLVEVLSDRQTPDSSGDVFAYSLEDTVNGPAIPALELNSVKELPVPIEPSFAAMILPEVLI